MSQTLLIPIDGSEHALRAVDWVIKQLPEWKVAPTIHLLNVQPSLHGDIGRFVSAAQLESYHRDEGNKALGPALEKMQAAGVSAQPHVRIGESATLIQEFATEKSCAQIIIGTRGHSGLTGMLLGSVATKLAHLATIPVILVR